MLNLATLSLLLAVLLDVAAAVPAPAAAANISLGSRLDRQYTGYVAQPLTAVEARSAGWFPMEFNAAPSDKCNRHVGSPWVFNKATPGTLSQDHPVILFYSAAGQISGIAVAIMGADGGSHAEWTEAMRALARPWAWKRGMEQRNVSAAVVVQVDWKWRASAWSWAWVR